MSSSSIGWIRPAATSWCSRPATTWSETARSRCARRRGLIPSRFRWRGLSASRATRSSWSGWTVSTIRRCSTSSRISHRRIRCPRLTLAGTPTASAELLKQRRYRADADHRQIDRSVGETQRQYRGGLFVNLRRPAHLLDIVDDARSRALANDAAQPRHQAVEGRETLPRLAARTGHAADALIDQLIEAHERHDVFDARNGDIDGAVEPAVLVHGDRTCADHDRIGAFEAQRFDLDVAAVRLYLAESVWQRLGRQIFQAADYDVDVAPQRVGGHAMQRRRDGGCEMQHRVDDRIVVGGAGNDAGIQRCVVSREPRDCAGAGAVIEVQMVDVHRDALWIRWNTADAQPPQRPRGDEARRCFVWRLYRDRTGHFTDQRGWMINLRRDGHVVGGNDE